MNLKESIVINGMIEITGKRHYDLRGAFEEVFSVDHLNALFPNGIKQISHSFNKWGSLRGLHYQTNMSKIMRVVRGSAHILHVDINKMSPTYGLVTNHLLMENDTLGLFAPPLVARGFLAFDNDTVIEYLHDAVFEPDATHTIAWDDPAILKHWNTYSGISPAAFIISDKDRMGGKLLKNKEEIVN